ncbi:hypothetical protein EVAR_11488_1 [Eumeta japonica]|uniref:Uncharacterized protein n=1 Tax=Eumeta variegata TaxID=151549 RepID=A0A4C1TZY5_EUMVA|nr:hypothetical protein EVAR_11488_1 [Eumeta japonica]
MLEWVIDDPGEPPCRLTSRRSAERSLGVPPRMAVKRRQITTVWTPWPRCPEECQFGADPDFADDRLKCTGGRVAIA